MSLERLNELKAKGTKTSPAEKSELKKLKEELLQPEKEEPEVPPAEPSSIEESSKAKVDKLNKEQEIKPVRYDTKCGYEYPGRKLCERPFGDVLYNGNMMIGCPTNDPKHHVLNGTLPASSLPESINH